MSETSGDTWLDTILGKDPFVCAVDKQVVNGKLETTYSYNCAHRSMAIALVFIFLSLWIMRVARRKLNKLLDDMTNLFGVSIFTVRVFEQILFAMRINILEHVWNTIMMYINSYMLKNKFITIENEEQG